MANVLWGVLLFWFICFFSLEVVRLIRCSFVSFFLRAVHIIGCAFGCLALFWSGGLSSFASVRINMCARRIIMVTSVGLARYIVRAP